MDEILSATVDSRNGIVLDPRTKLFMLITITTLMFSTSNDGIMNIVKPILSLIPFALILSEHKFKTAGKYAVLYAVCFVLERLALNVWSGMISFLILAATSIMTRFFYICEYLNITPQEFFNFDAAAPRKAKELLHEIEKLTPEQSEHVLQIVRDISYK